MGTVRAIAMLVLAALLLPACATGGVATIDAAYDGPPELLTCLYRDDAGRVNVLFDRSSGSNEQIQRDVAALSAALSRPPTSSIWNIVVSPSGDGRALLVTDMDSEQGGVWVIPDWQRPSDIVHVPDFEYARWVGPRYAVLSGSHTLDSVLVDGRQPEDRWTIPRGTVISAVAEDGRWVGLVNDSLSVGHIASLGEHHRDLGKTTGLEVRDYRSATLLHGGAIIATWVREEVVDLYSFEDGDLIGSVPGRWAASWDTGFVIHRNGGFRPYEFVDVDASGNTTMRPNRLSKRPYRVSPTGQCTLVRSGGSLMRRLAARRTSAVGPWPRTPRLPDERNVIGWLTWEPPSAE